MAFLKADCNLIFMSGIGSTENVIDVIQLEQIIN